MQKELSCSECKKYMATIRSARMRNGMVVYCRECNEKIQRLLHEAKNPEHEMPDFMRSIFGDI